MVSEPARRARELRRSMPQAEVWLWNRLKRLRERGYRFRRQHPFHGYFLDFVCLDRMVVVEVDGGQHADPSHAEHDAVRDRILGRAGFRVLRFWNSEIRHDMDRVMDLIVQALETRPSRLGKDGPGEAPSVSATPPP